MSQISSGHGRREGPAPGGPPGGLPGAASPAPSSSGTLPRPEVPGIDTPQPDTATRTRAHSRLAAVRAHLELPLVRRASGALEGRHRSILSGHGQDFDEMSLYHPGDDVADIDWRASARSGQPVIKRFERTSNISTVLVVDTARTMSAAGDEGGKAELAQFACDVIGFLASGRGDTLALVAGDADRVVQMPARSGNDHIETLLRRVVTLMTADAGHSDLPRLLDRAGLVMNERRSLVVLVTDETRPRGDASRALRRLASMHEVIVIRVADMPAARYLAGAYEDVEDASGLPRFLWGRDDVISDAQQEQQTRREAVDRLLERSGVTSLTVGSRDELVRRIVETFIRSRRRAR